MSATQPYQKIISADSHVMEPLELWWNALGQKFGDRTPRPLSEYRGQKGTFFYTGYKGWPVSQIRMNNPDTEAAMLEAEERGLAECGYNPEVRVKFQEEAGIEAEVLNTTRLLAIMRNPDVEIVQACAQVFNDWEAEFASYNPRRLIGVSVIPMHDVDWAVKELERTVRKGHRSAMINCQAPEGCPSYRNHNYDRFWAAAQDANIPITLHLLTGRALDPLIFAYAQTPEQRGENPGLWVDLFNEIQGTLANDFIFGGILDRFPTLTIVCSEFEISWVPGFMARLDQIEEIAPRLHVPKLKMRASDYMRTRIYHGFIDDTFAAESIPLIGTSQILWGSDFPHIRSIGLEAHEAVNKLLEVLPRADQEKVVGGNAAKVFNVN
jgi:predicted TIM-barrel fold metal-dependent hydrolase